MRSVIYGHEPTRGLQKPHVILASPEEVTMSLTPQATAVPPALQQAIDSPALADQPTPALEAELTTLAAHIQAATARLLALLAGLDRREAWATSGALSCAHWLAFRTGLDLGAAREHVRVARTLTKLPAISAAFGRSELSYSKVRAMTRIARPETEADLVVMAREGTAAQLERLVRAYRRADPVAENAAARAQQEARRLHTHWADDGMLVIQARLTPEQGAQALRQLATAATAR
jgi:hypothetical protein